VTCDHRRWGIRDCRKARHRRRQCVLQIGSGRTIPVVKDAQVGSGRTIPVVREAMELYCSPKVNTLQLNTASNSWNTRTRATRTVSEHSLLYNSSNRTSCGNLPTLTPILAVRKLPNTRRDNPSSGYRFTCAPQRHLGVYIIKPPFTSPGDRMSSPSTV
jgi:hypothetical protein